jgi:hypothetical protein
MRWKIIICQHPMPLLIQKGDKEILEREPPWGENSLPDYLERINKNMAYIEKYPDFKLNYDLSALELEMIEKHRPDLLERMKINLANGKIGFVGGTYSQSHLQMFDSESTFLQFEFGNEIFKRLINQSFLSYSTQETSLHEQLPQILRHMGYEFTTVPAFYWTLDFISEREMPTLVGNWLHKAFVYDVSTSLWRGLDGTEIPLFLEVTDRWSDDFFFRKEQKDLFGESDLYVFFPDLLEIDEKFGNEISNRGDTGLLDVSLSKEFSKYPPKSVTRLSTFWSYAEGTDAEATLRENNIAIMKVQQAESLSAFMLGLGFCEWSSFNTQWHRILATQHHDVHWCETKRLKNEAKADLGACSEEADKAIIYMGEKILNRVQVEKDSAYKLMVFNSLPYERTDIAEFQINFNQGIARDVIIRDQYGVIIPSQITESKNFEDGTIQSCKCLIIATLKGLGYCTYGITPTLDVICKPTTKTLNDIGEDITFSNSYFDAIINRSGYIKELRPNSYEKNLLSKEGGSWFSINRKRPKYAGNNSHSSIQSIVEGNLSTFVSVETEFKSFNTKIITNISLFKDLPKIHFKHKMEFEKSNIATLWEDENKLNWIWSFNFTGEIIHDIPFGSCKEKIGRPILCPSWVDFGNEQAGVTIAQFNNPKFWSRDSKIGNVIAWGGKNISNRQHRFWVENAEFSTLLNGTRFAEHAVFPHLGDWAQVGISRMVRSYREPFMTFIIPSVEDKVFEPLQNELFLLSINNKNLMPTSTRRDESENSFSVRFYESSGEKISDFKIFTNNGIKATVLDLEGNQLSEIRGFKIGFIHCIRKEI